MPECYIRIIDRVANFELSVEEIIDAEFSRTYSDDEGNKMRLPESSISLYKLSEDSGEVFEQELAQILIEHCAQIPLDYNSKRAVVLITDLIDTTRLRQTPTTSKIKFPFVNERHYSYPFDEGELEALVMGIRSSLLERYRAADDELIYTWVNKKIAERDTAWTAAIKFIEQESKSRRFKGWKRFPPGENYFHKLEELLG